MPTNRTMKPGHVSRFASVGTGAAPTAYEVEHARRVLGRHAKATGAKAPTATPKPVAAKPVATATAVRPQAAQQSRFAHLNVEAFVIQAEPVAERIVSPAVARAEKAEADRLDRVDMLCLGRVRSDAERKASAAKASAAAEMVIAATKGVRL
jgi:hypothetical protein